MPDHLIINRNILNTFFFTTIILLVGIRMLIAKAKKYEQIVDDNSA